MCGFFDSCFFVCLCSDIAGQATPENEAWLERCKKERTRLYNAIKEARDVYGCVCTIDGKVKERDEDIDGFLINFGKRIGDLKQV